VLVGALHVPPAAMGIIIPGWLLTTFLTARTTYRLTSKRRVAELEQLADRLAALAQELILEPGPLGPPPPPRLR